MEFNENKIVLQFPVISDLHIMGKGQYTSQKLENAYEQIKKIGRPDAVVFAGDMTDFGLKEQVTEFCEITRRHFDLDKVRLLLAIGNHELYHHELQGAPLTVSGDFKEALGVQGYYGATADEVRAGNHRMVLRGYHFIAVNAYKYSGGVDFRDEDVAWLEQKLEEAVQSDPEKPIFVCAHPMVTGTNYGSDYGAYWAGDRLYSLLQRYPQVIYFAGHLHFPLQNEHTVWQGDFTTVGTSSVYFCSLEDHDHKGLKYEDILVGSEPNDCKNFSQGLYVEVDDCANVRISRWDFEHGGQIKQPWILPHPDAAKNQLGRYTKERFLEGKQQPFFPAGASVNEREKDLASPVPVYSLSFPAAQDSDMVMGYEIRFIESDTGQAIKKLAVYSDFYLHPQAEQMEKIVVRQFAPGRLAPFHPYYEKDYYIEVVARDCFGLESEPIRSALIKGETRKETDPFLQVPAGIRFAQLVSFDRCKKGQELAYNRDYFSWPPIERGDGAMPQYISERSGNKAAGAILKSGCYQFYVYPATVPGTDFSGSPEIWFWVDFTDLVFTRLYFGVNDGGTEYVTDDRNGCDMRAYIKKAGVWQSVPFSYDGCLEQFGDYRGYIRFSTAYLYNAADKAVAPLCDVRNFKIGFQVDGDLPWKEREYAVADVKFALK